MQYPTHCRIVPQFLIVVTGSYLVLHISAGQYYIALHKNEKLAVFYFSLLFFVDN